MIKRILSMVCLLASYSCSLNKGSVEMNQNLSMKDEWQIISTIEREKWNKDKIIQMFGKPGQVYAKEGDSIESLIYYDEKLGFQNWAFGINQDGSLSNFVFIPNYTNRNKFLPEIIKNKWKENCIKKVDTDLSQHFIRKIYHLQCGNHKRVDLTNHDEVISLYIELK